MPTNPEQEARQVMIGRLRGMASSLDDGYGIGVMESPRSLSVHLNQAANEVEALGTLHERFLHGFRQRLYFTLRNALDAFHPCDAFGSEPQTICNWDDDRPGAFTLTFTDNEVRIALSVQITHKLPRNN